MEMVASRQLSDPGSFHQASAKISSATARNEVGITKKITQGNSGHRGQPDRVDEHHRARPTSARLGGQRFP
jgi:hypothetical protein